MLTVVTWLWGNTFSPLYVSRLRSMLKRHVRIPHELVCITDKPQFVHAEADGVRVVPMPVEHSHMRRCCRRMWQYGYGRLHDLGERILAIDLDVVITDDLTPVVDRPEPLVCWKVGYAGVYSGSFVMFDAGVLDRMWRTFQADPDGFAAASKEQTASDQAMLNHWLTVTRTPVAQWTERDGFVTWFGGQRGDRYHRMQHLGMGPDRPQLPRGTRIVVLGSADKAVMDEGRYPFVREHWQ